MQTIHKEKLLEVRSSVPEDRNDLLQLLEATGVFQSYEIKIADEVISDSYKPGSDYSLFCAVNESNRAVGYVCWGPTPCTVGTYDLYWIAVHPEFQRFGVGKKLLTFAEENAKSCGARLMIIETSSLAEYEHTRNFYLRCGYSELAKLRDFYRPGDHKIIYGKYFVS